jgi:predicted nuclease of predicted toxin-antitoxin system
VLIIALGNCGNDNLIATLESSWTAITSELSSGTRLVILHPNRLEILI